MIGRVAEWRNGRRKPWLLLAAAACVLATGLLAANKWRSRPRPALSSDRQQRDAAVSGYADPSACAACHRSIAATYALTGMARSLSKVRADDVTHGRFYHAASNRHYTILERDGAVVQRRHQVGFGGTDTNVVELSADYVIGSGNHARTYVHRASDNRLLQLPVSWYADGGGRWAMSPGYDRRDHLDFRRVIDEGCMSCHDAYPRGEVHDDGTGPQFTGGLPEGIDCQRCHGPGQRHIAAMRAGNVSAGRTAIVNPATLDRERQLEVCMQCHLEPTSSPLPFQIRRYEHPPFSYLPGRPLGDAFIYFDHAEAATRNRDYGDKFEIAGGAYRLRQSACFRNSQMTCLTCHDPHDIPRGDKAVQHYVAVCVSCHETAHARGVPQVTLAGPRSTCLDCHMPKRRAEDAVHVVITDHLVQRVRPTRDLTASLNETAALGAKDYRGEVALYYPSALPSTPENELYLALAQVQQGSNLTTGIPRLREAIERHNPSRAEFYYELARAYSKTADHAAVVRWSEIALQHDASFAPALKELGSAAAALGQWDRAVDALQRAIALRPRDAHALADLGNAYLQQHRVDETIVVARQALALDAGLPRASNTLGLASLATGDPNEAERQFREAVRIQPDFAEAHNNLANLLAGRHAYREAAYHFEEALRCDPKYVEAHHSYGVVLGVMRSFTRAVAELQEAVRLSPALARPHTDLADVLAIMGRIDQAVREYELAIAANPREYEAHYGLGEVLARQARTREAVAHFEAAAQSSDAALQEAARARLAALR
jgi:predicted CXXCH cytochrome family protein